MGLWNGIGNGIGRKKSGIDWNSYWTTREPTALILTVLSDTSIQLDWTANGVEDYDGYSVERSADGITYAEIDTVAVGAETFTDTGLTKETIYYYRIRAYKGGAYSSYSNAAYEYTFGEWYLLGGIPTANAIAVYEPAGAASLVLSKSNIVNPGTYDASGGVDPDWDVVNGWKFNGSSQYLVTGIVPESDQTWSMIVKFTGYTTGDNTIVGLYQDGTRQFRLTLDNVNGCVGGNGKNVAKTPVITEGTLCISGAKFFINGVDSGLGIIGFTGTVTYDIYIGCTHYSSLTGYFDGNIQDIAVFDSVLTASQINMMHNMLVKDATYIEKYNYINRSFGALICWSVGSFTNEEWTTANLDIDTFAPTGLDVDNWLDACVSAGMRYAVFTAKHHDGFALWPTSFFVPTYDPYSIASGAWYVNNGSPDIVKLFVDGCRERGIAVGLYFSMWDTTWETRTGTDETTNAAGYLAMIEAQLTELLTNYGQIDMLWIDGWKAMLGFEEISWLTIYNFVKAIQPHCIIVGNIQTHPATETEIEVYETTYEAAIAGTNTRLSEEVNNIRTDKKWFYNSTLDQTAAALRAAADIKAAVVNANTLNAAYLLGITVGTDGHLPAAQVTRLGDVGAL